MTVLSVVLSMIVAPLFMFGVFMPRFVMMYPALALLLLGYVGPVSVVACCMVLMGLCMTLYGTMGMLCIVILLLPALISAMLTVKRRLGFFISCSILACTLFVSMSLALGVISFAAKADIATALSDMIGTTFDELGELADPILSTFAQMGIVNLPNGMGQLGESLRLTAEMRQEMIDSIVFLLNTGLRLELPMQMTVGALGAGVLGQTALRCGLRSRGLNVPYTPIRKWHLPSGWGRVLGVTLGILFVFASLLPQNLIVMAYVFSGVFTELFALQGIATVSHVLHEHNKGKRWIVIVFAVGYTLLRTPFMFLGIADQALDITHRRKMLEAKDNPYDPKSRK